MVRFIHSVDKLLKDFNSFLEKFALKFKKFFKHPLFLLSTLFLISLAAIYCAIMFYSEVGHIFIIGTLIFISFLLFMALAKTYLATKPFSSSLIKNDLVNNEIVIDIDYQSEKQIDNDLFDKVNHENNILEENNAINRKRHKSKKIQDPLSEKIINDLYTSLKSFGFLNAHELPEDIDQYVQSKEYFEKRINDLYLNNQTDNPIYLTGNQKKVGAAIFDIILPFLKTDASKISEYFFYQKKGEFVKVNYPSM